MINLKSFKGFCLVQSDNQLESLRLRKFCLTNDISLKYVSNYKISCLEDYIPCGGVDWTLLSLGKNIVPDYYPVWLEEYLYRKIWSGNEWILGRKLFVKPADKYKRFTGFVTFGTYKKKKKPPYIWSEVIQFKNEWRYYISNGKVLCAEWYWGDSYLQPNAPILNLNIPNNFCGAVDFGELLDGRIALIESQHPFACGWYGKHEKDYLYFQWLIDGWEYMKNVK